MKTLDQLTKEEISREELLACSEMEVHTTTPTKKQPKEQKKSEKKKKKCSSKLEDSTVKSTKVSKKIKIRAAQEKAKQIIKDARYHNESNTVTQLQKELAELKQMFETKETRNMDKSGIEVHIYTYIYIIYIYIYIMYAR